MTDIALYYPPTPANVPAGLAVPSTRYRLRVLGRHPCLAGEHCAAVAEPVRGRDSFSGRHPTTGGQAGD
jgi:hypothetical protein